MALRQEALSLYRNLLRTGKKFPNYNIREFVLRKTRQEFRINRDIQEAESVTKALAEARKELEVAKRQAVVYSMFAPSLKSIMDIGPKVTR